MKYILKLQESEASDSVHHVAVGLVPLLGEQGSKVLVTQSLAHASGRAKTRSVKLPCLTSQIHTSYCLLFSISCRL